LVKKTKVGKKGFGVGAKENTRDSLLEWFAFLSRSDVVSGLPYVIKQSLDMMSEWQERVVYPQGTRRPAA
jgi:hypothetical protein